MNESQKKTLNKTSASLEMDREEIQLIDKFFSDLVNDVIPVDMLPYLPCLTQNDKEKIRCEEANHGPMRATQELLNLLVRRRNAFHELVQALRRTRLEHLADLLHSPDDGILNTLCLLTLHFIFFFSSSRNFMLRRQIIPMLIKQ